MNISFKFSNDATCEYCRKTEKMYTRKIVFLESSFGTCGTTKINAKN